MRKPGFRFAFVLFASALPLLPQSKSPLHEWGYAGADGPAHWGALDPEYSACQAGKVQSPIDIRGAQSTSLPPIRFDYKSSPLKIVNNGHTIQVNYAPGSSITVGGERYELRQFHFHHPSEDRVDGRSSDMELHLVHANEKGDLAVVAILLRKGEANAVLRKIWPAMPKVAGPEREIPGVQIDASGFLPANHAYYTFRGSLTTPPCTEGVTWFVFTTPSNVSAEQIKAFAAVVPPNARPVQPLGPRVVKKSQ